MASAGSAKRSKAREYVFCNLGRQQCKTKVKTGKHRYQRRNRIETMFGRLKGLKRIATRFDRSLNVLLSAIVLTATAIYLL